MTGSQPPPNKCNTLTQCNTCVPLFVQESEYQVTGDVKDIFPDFVKVGSM